MDSARGERAQCLCCGPIEALCMAPEPTLCECSAETQKTAAHRALQLKGFRRTLAEMLTS